ncbi:MAG: hypothetical protein JO283_15725 [Bradyrhizobium sp.]|nr:hypothetical protein [Bradyrhizobium sp.]
MISIVEELAVEVAAAGIVQTTLGFVSGLLSAPGHRRRHGNGAHAPLRHNKRARGH